MRSIWLIAILTVWVVSLDGFSQESLPSSPLHRLVKETCCDCHTGERLAGQFRIPQELISEELIRRGDFDPVPWERMLRRVRAGQMPPPADIDIDLKLVDDARLEMEKLLDLREDIEPFFPKSNSLRRLTRTEYQNSIRDLIGLSIDASSLLPKDESSHGFDNITVSELSPTFISRAVQAAQLISRKALGLRSIDMSAITIRVPPERSQESHVEGLPWGTRGGTVFDYHFPQTGRYEFQIRLTRDRDEKVEGLARSSPIDVLIDRKRYHRFEAPKPFRPDDHTLVDTNLNVSLDVLAGTHQIGVTFPLLDESLIEIKRQPFDTAFNQHRHPRIHPAIYEVSVMGPLDSTPETIPETLVTTRLFGDLPRNPAPEQQRHVAEQVLSCLARVAYRRPVSKEDTKQIMHFFDVGKQNGFPAGMELALASILVNPNFLLRVEPINISLDEYGNGNRADQEIEGSSRRLQTINDWELATRLSFFLWSSLPDEELLNLAELNRLHEPSNLTQQVRRMLKDPRADALVTNFGSQWLYLRNLGAMTPDLRLYPDFDDNLRAAMRNETESLFREIINEDRSVLGLIRSDHTYLNERLAIHYEIPGVLGSSMRRVALPDDSKRGGLLRHGSVLAVTSYATRTSPTIRGSWILENLLGTPPPPPPPNVPALKESSESVPTSTRERLALHRDNPACASCHNLMDPIGFALENYDALGRWRLWEGDSRINSSGLLPDGTRANSVENIEASLLKRPEVFVGTMVEKLLTFALGRGIEPQEGPQIRRIVRSAAQHDYRFSSIIESIVKSPLFQKRSEE